MCIVDKLILLVMEVKDVESVGVGRYIVNSHEVVVISIQIILKLKLGMKLQLCFHRISTEIIVRKFHLLGQGMERKVKRAHKLDLFLLRLTIWISSSVTFVDLN